MIDLSDIRVLIKGGGEMASGVAHRLFRCGFRMLLTEIEYPMAVRRKVSFCEAVYDGQAQVEEVEARLATRIDEVSGIWNDEKIPILVDPQCESRRTIKPDVLVDAILAKKNLGTSIKDSPLVIALGPGFQAGKDAHVVIETNRGHNLGRLIIKGSAEANTGVPGSINGITKDRVLIAPADGIWQNSKEIGDPVKQGALIGAISNTPVRAQIDGVLRGMIRSGIHVAEGVKVGDIDPRGKKEFCYTISDKARSIGGAVLEAIIGYFGT